MKLVIKLGELARIEQWLSPITLPGIDSPYKYVPRWPEG
jgi:O-succinylbenzoate synthase